MNRGDAFRIAVGILTTLGGGALLLHHATPTSLGVAVVALGIFILSHWAIEAHFMHIRSTYTPPADSGMRDFASSFIATSGVILGLLALFGDKGVKLTATLKVGIVALAVDILLGFVLVGLLLAGADPGTPTEGGGATAPDQKAWNVIRYVFNAALWALSLGLLCIATALVYR